MDSDIENVESRQEIDKIIDEHEIGMKDLIEAFGIQEDIEEHIFRLKEMFEDFGEPIINSHLIRLLDSLIIKFIVKFYTLDEIKEIAKDFRVKTEEDSRQEEIEMLNEIELVKLLEIFDVKDFINDDLIDEVLNHYDLNDIKKSLEINVKTNSKKKLRKILKKELNQFEFEEFLDMFNLNKKVIHDHVIKLLLMSWDSYTILSFIEMDKWLDSLVDFFHFCFC